MITNLLLGLANLIISAIDAILPSFTVPSWLEAGTLVPSGLTNFIGSALYIIHPFFPSAVMTEIVVGVFSLWPAIAAYTVAQWIYRHIPTIAGFSVGAG
jgi:hypothetical protein